MQHLLRQRNCWLFRNEKICAVGWGSGFTNLDLLVAPLKILNNLQLFSSRAKVSVRQRLARQRSWGSVFMETESTRLRLPQFSQAIKRDPLIVTAWWTQRMTCGGAQAQVEWRNTNDGNATGMPMQNTLMQSSYVTPKVRLNVHIILLCKIQKWKLLWMHCWSFLWRIAASACPFLRTAYDAATWF